MDNTEIKKFIAERVAAGVSLSKIQDGGSSGFRFRRNGPLSQLFPEVREQVLHKLSSVPRR